VQVNLIQNSVRWFIKGMHEVRIKLMSIRDFIIEKWNNLEVMPSDWSLNIIWFLSWALYVFIVAWVFWWLSYVTVDSAKWALSAQVQATAAIFGLLIAAIALRWRHITDQEQLLRNNIYSYLQALSATAKPPTERTVLVLELAYDDYLKVITEKREKKGKVAKKVFVDLGRLWVISNLSYQYRFHLIFGRYLTRGQTKGLSKISKLSMKSAVNMWEDYHKHPEDFILNMLETLNGVAVLLNASMLAKSNSYGGKGDKELVRKEAVILALRDIGRSIISSNSKVIAEEVKRTRLTLQPRFYFTSLVLAFAIVLGLCILTGIEGTLLPPIFSNPNNLMWVVGIPIGLSIFGIALCLDIIRRII
jgi:hypothetical protein